MAINFSGTAERLEYTSSNVEQVTALVAFSVWFNKDSSSTISRALMLGGGAGGDGFMVAFNFSSFNGVDIVGSRNSGNWGGQANGKLRAATTVGQWHHVCGTVSANGLSEAGSKEILSAYLDGVLMTDTGGGAASPGSGNTIVSIAARAGGTSHFDGQLAEVAIWEGVEITSEEALALAAGAPATSIQSQAIKFYSRLDEINSSDLITGNAVTVVGTPDNTEHAPVTQVPLNAVVPTVSVGGQNLSPTGIASAESFGSPTITTGVVALTATGIASAESFGVPTVSLGGVILTATGIASEESFGSPTLTTGAVNLSATGIPSEEAFGTAVVTQGFLLQATGIPSTESIGTPTITTGAVNLTATGIASAESFGSHTIAVAGDKDIKIDFANELVLTSNLQSTTLYFNGTDYFTID